MAQPIGKGQAGGGIPQQRAQDNSATTRAISNLGGAIAQTGKLAEQMHDEQKRQWTGKAELQFAEAEGALQVKLARTPDPSKHQKIAQKHFEEAKAKILNNESYTKKFRNELTDRLNLAGATRLNKITTNASLQQVRNGRQINNERIKNRLADHDYAGAAQLINGSIGVYLTPEMAQVQLEEVGMRQEDYAKKQVKDDAINEIAGDPMGWMERNQEPWEGDMAGDWVSLQSHAKSVRRSKGYEETDNVLDLIYSDKLTDPKQIEQLTPHLRPKARESLRAEHFKRQEYLAEGIRSSSVDQDSLIGTVGNLIKNYEASDTEDFDDAYYHLDSLIRDIKDPALKAEYNRQLKAKRSGQWAESKEKRDVAVKVFDDAIEGSSALVPEAAPYEELSKGSYVDAGFLSDQDRLRSFGFSEDQAKKISEASEKYREGNETGEDPEDLVRRFWSKSSKMDADFPKSERAVFDAIRHYKTDAYAVPNPTAAGRADLAEREREVENTRIKGQLRQKFMKYLERHPDATPEEIQQKSHGLGVEFTTESIKSRMFPKQRDRTSASVGTGDAFRVASSYLGVRELADAQSNPQIDKWIRSINPDLATDSTAWCSAFVNGVAEEAGFKGSGKLNAKSWLKVGDEVPAAQAQQGDVVVLWRDNKSSWKGHVGFFHGYDKKGNIRVLGGNQGNQVSIKTYPSNRLLGFRRLNEPNA